MLMVEAGNCATRGNTGNPSSPGSIPRSPSCRDHGSTDRPIGWRKVISRAKVGRGKSLAAGHEAPSPESDMEWMHSVGWLIRRMEHHGFEQIIMAMPVAKKFKKFMTLYLKHAHKKILAVNLQLDVHKNHF
ncbi:uncharacterized protein PADG_07052 [Paracoccidioides brasiliensis Pb18]|uniref:Uncharacterized protein n=1 Tax=Paracoccidioides brasiliensis (strain Pb18) TaxID=502780 RepID=C1GIG6_PARBD|nr:uncharacterized protein PADG_07052 [Paracoccidioides brasiliensis Pb18]EEH42232.2 hypothetical protein PADG_07052 [Paracoccidioides brasiliensis Pb18]ODH51821.1 hypothetical protein GX48_02065 [Paracoccidioides brasiliensis]